MWRGSRAIKSLAAESELAEMLTPRAASAKEKAAKNRQARLSQLAIKAIGSHSRCPYFCAPADDAAMPMKEMKVKTIGSMGT